MDMMFDNLSALIAISAIALGFGALLGYAAVKFKVEGNPIVEQVDALLPQTQCGQCGTPDAAPMQRALQKAKPSINACRAEMIPFVHWPIFWAVSLFRWMKSTVRHRKPK